MPPEGGEPGKIIDGNLRAGEIDERRAAARFEPQMEDAAEMPPRDLDAVMDEARGGPSTGQPARPTSQQTSLAAEEEQSYTSRLLDAKKKACKDKEKND